ncbi:alginate lyase family protein [Glycomyces luteolus]|uniref:Alginate lyase family protein n=1 Tax=Glycomyces luteolus TaxID=2670330 RepID=A0A9X3P8V2_9ACTN|nr:alginate lyase family protein [Glycomyces luteolus]MDA1360951.1 alginate lyase family protein [Glycomyces luteolus]
MDRYQTTRRTLLRGAAGSLIAVTAANALPAQAGQAAPPTSTAGAAFAHPGLLHSAADLERMRTAVAAQEAPIHQGFTAMAAHARSSFDYRIRNTGQITSWGRGPTDNTAEAAEDAGAAYQNALMWAITGDDRHADKARDILNAWSASLKTITGADGQLGAGLQGFKLVNAAEILRHGEYDGWADADIARCERSFKDVWYPSVSGYALFANGNWDVAALQLVIAIAVFCDDRVMFEDAVRYAAGGAGNGSITGIVVDESGQGQESGRTQAYAQLAIGLLTDVAEVAWNQGVDLYGHKGNRILAGYEYVSRYNLGEDVPFTADLDRTGKYLKTVVATGNRGQWRPIHELAYGHYATRMGLAVPYTERVVFRGTGGTRFIEGHNDDHPSWGTLTFARSQADTSVPQTPPPAPAGLAAHGSPEGITVSWVGSVDPASMAAADGYTVKRAALDEDEYEVIATGIASTSYTDESVEPGRTYLYVVAAANEAGTGPDSLGIAVSAGLPAPWEAADIGDSAPAGGTDFDGQAFRIKAGGNDIAGVEDRFRFTHLPLTGDGTITARIAHPVSSQYAKVGLMMRESLEPDAAHASMLIQGLPLHTWSGVWTTRTTTGGDTAGTGSTPVPPTQQTEITVNAGFPIADHGSLPSSATPLPAPYVEGASDGYRWRRPYWVRLRRKGTKFTGWISPNGEDWEKVGTSELDLPEDLYIGLAVCSVLGGDADHPETTSAVFDNVTAPGWSVGAPAAQVGDLRAWTGASAVELAWSATDLSGRYTVKRAPANGGRYTVLACGIGPVGFGVQVRYADPTGAPGTEYRYIVCASNTDGDGPPSLEARAVMPTPPKPEITAAATAFANAGKPFHYLIRAANDPAGFTATGLPDGLHLDATTGTITGTATAAGAFTVEVGAVNATGSAAGSLAITIGSPPPAPWTYRDIGDRVPDERMLGSRSVVAIRAPGITGHDADTGTFTLRGAGADLNVINQGMTAHFASVPMEGDGTITARLSSWTGASANGRVGLAMAKSLNPFDQMTATVLGANGTVQFFRRTRVAFRPNTTDGPNNVGAPIWLRLSRTGDAFAAATSADGQTWTPIGEPHAIPAFGTAPYHVGLAVVSGDPTALSTAVFDQVTVTGSG